jgi:hypothetical protein
MAFSLLWLPAVLKNAGLKVAVVPGWEDRGTRDMGDVVGVICHHTAGPRQGNMPSMRILLEGRSNLEGPLCQLGLGRDGTYYVIAAGRANHAGKGIWQGFVNGNANFIGIEAENTGRGDDFPWPNIQMEAYQHGVAAILKHIGRGADFCAGHKEYALPKGRKPDCSFDMVTFRAVVDSILKGQAAAIRPIPAAEPTAGGPGRPTLRRGNRGEWVAHIQAKLSLQADGSFGPKTEATLRQFQRHQGLVPDGIVGPKTWTALDRA